MSKIARYTGNLRAFGSNAQGLERTLFGETTQADDLTSQVTPAFLRGWGIVGPSENPSMEDFNAAMYTMSQFIAYQHQMGIPEWDASQEYYVGSLCVRAGETYSSLASNNIGSAPPSTKWTQVITVKNGLSSLGIADANGYVGRLLNIADFTATGTYTPTPGTRFIIVEVTGGGGGGGASNTTGATSVSVGAGGGAGGTAISKLNISDIATPVSVMVGNGGAAANSSTIATSGGQSSFGSYLFATGGDFGVSGTTITQGDTAMVYNGGGGQGVNGNLDNMIGGSGGFGIILKFGYESGWGGRSYYSSGGNPIVTLGTPNPGFAGRKGSGGSGGFGANNSPVQNGGAGGSGFVRIWEYA